MIRRLFPIIIGIILIAVFFFRLFWPKLSIFMIPDFGESDVLHLNYPLKFILSQSLKNKAWPLWTPFLASGFPVLAEGQIGTFYLPNLFLFRFLNPVIAYDLNIVLAYIFIFTGTYIFAKRINFSTISSLYAAFIFTFSGFFSVHLNHFNLLQAASLLPFLFWASFLIWEKADFPSIILFSILFSQQIFTGHFYIVVITLVGIIIFWLGLYLTSMKEVKYLSLLKRLLYLLSGIIFSLLLSSIQLLPTIELWQTSARKGGLDFATVTSFPYPFSHLLSFFSPYIFGDPAKGTYPIFSSDWGIFWENTAYIGILPLILAIISLIFFKKKWIKINLLLFLASIFLVLGKFSPFYFIFSFPPFNLFRVPSKFLILSSFSLVILSSYTINRIHEGVNRLINKKYKNQLRHEMVLLLYFIFSASIFIFIFIDVFKFSFNYLPVSEAYPWFNLPESAGFLSQKKGRIASLGAPLTWNSIFLKNGWQDISPYLYFRNNLYPNFNAIFSISNQDINTGGLIPKRVGLFTNMMKNISYDEKEKIATVSSMSKNALYLAGVKYLISAFNIYDPSIKVSRKINPPQNLKLDPFFIYENAKSLPRSYIVYRTKSVSTVEQLYDFVAEENFSDEHQVLIEDDKLQLTSPEKESKPFGKSEITSETDNKINIQVQTDQDGVLVLTDTNYTGWHALIEAQETPIYYVNLSQRGVKLHPGKYNVVFYLKSEVFEIGKLITIISGLTISLTVFLYPSFFPHKASRNKRLSDCL